MERPTKERSLYGPLDNLLTAVGATLRPKVFCVQELADQGAGHPDFGLYAAKQVQKGAPRDGQTLLPLDAGANAVLRHLLRVGAVGAYGRGVAGAGTAV